MNGAVVVGYDETRSGARALALAADEAAMRGVRLEIVNVIRPDGRPRSPDAADALAEWIVGEGEQTIHETHPDLSVDKRTAVGLPEEVLAGEAQSAGMLVLGDRSHRVLATLREGAVAVHVLDRATCPVVVLNPDDHGRRDRITVAVSLDGPTDELLSFAFEEAARRGAVLGVVTVCDSHVKTDQGARGAEEIGSGAALVAETEEGLEKAVRPWRARYPQLKLKTEVVVRSGAIGQALVEATCEGDLLIVGGPRRPGGRPGMEIGPAGHTLLHHAECPVVLLPVG